MEKQLIGTPVTIRLEVSATNILLDDIATQIYHPLRRDIREKLFRYGRKFSLLLYLQHQWDVRRVDFRYALLDGLIPEPFSDEKKCQHIRRTLIAETAAMSQDFYEAARRYSAEDLALGERLLAEKQRAMEARGPVFPLSADDLYCYFEIALAPRIWQMLYDDAATEVLVVNNGLDGELIVLLDHLVAWAIDRKITVEQEALPGCVSFVHESYQRVRQQIPIGSQRTATTIEIRTPERNLDLSGTKPWEIKRHEDPEPKYPWYTPARYFARELVRSDTTLLTKRDALAGKVAASLLKAGYRKRGGKKGFNHDTVKKALSNVVLG